MFTANIMEQFSGSLKLYMTLRLRQWILDQMRTDHQMHTGWHLANKQWGNGSSSSFSKKDYATPKDIGTVTISTPISMSTLYQGFICASSTSGPSLFVGFVTAYSGNSLTVRLITSLDSGSGGSLVPNYILLGR